jgi:ribosomal-protein-alanine N-acetyltransferase
VGADAAAPGPPVYVEAAGTDDVEDLVGLERRSFSNPWTAGHFRQALAIPERGRVLLLRAAVGDDPKGMVGYCVFEMVVDEVHVHNLAIAPSRRRQGLGRRLLALTIDIARRRGARSALLEVRQGNWPALELYRSMGFRPVGRRRGYYTRPTEDAVVLRNDALVEISRGAC